MEATAVPTGGRMSEAKRGRLRSVSIRPMYDEKGKISGHTVAADHEAEPESGKVGYVPPIESPHETTDSAMAKAKEHIDNNAEKQGVAGEKGRSMKQAILAAMHGHDEGGGYGRDPLSQDSLHNKPGL